MAKYTVEEYCNTLELAGRSPKTIDNYRKVIKSYADFLGVRLDQVHDHLSVGELLKYAASRREKSARGTKLNLSILQRYFKLNGIQFDDLQAAAMKPKRIITNDDKPLTLETLQRMMDLADVHSKAILSFLISTGCRAGETCNILVSDVDGDVVTVRDEIAKGGHGGKAYLTREAREYLDLWLKERDNYIRIADARQMGLVDSGLAKKRPENDNRLFCVSYGSLHHIFDRLYTKVDGEQKNGRARCTLHSCRKYFRTNAVKTIPLDYVETIMRHKGYLTDSYVRIDEKDLLEKFREGEAALYITRADHRVQAEKLSALELQNKELMERLNAIEAERTIVSADEQRLFEQFKRFMANQKNQT